MVFHSLQALHWPCHLEYCVPQLWQKNEVFIFDIFVKSYVFSTMKQRNEEFVFIIFVANAFVILCF